MHLPDCLYRASFVKVAVKLWSRRKKWVLGHRFVGEFDAPDFGHAFSNGTHFRALWSFLVEFRSASSEESWRKKKKEEEEESVVKPKSDDDCVGRPNNLSVLRKLKYKRKSTSKVSQTYRKIGTIDNS